MLAWFAGSRLRGACGVRPDDGGLVARLEAGRATLLKHPALTIIGGFSLAAAIAIGAVGIELADELLYKRLPFDEGGRVRAPGDAGRDGVTRGAKGAPRFRDLAAVSQDGGRTRRRARERAQRAHGRRPRRIPARGGDHGVGVSAHPSAAVARQAAAADGRNAGGGARRGPGLRRLAATVPARPGDHRPAS